MCWQDHMKTTEIAAKLRVAEGTVHAHLHAARGKPITDLEPYYPMANYGKDGNSDGQSSGKGKRLDHRYACRPLGW